MSKFLPKIAMPMVTEVLEEEMESDLDEMNAMGKVEQAKGILEDRRCGYQRYP